MPPAQLGRSAIGFSPAQPAVCRCSIEAPLANRKRPSPRLQELGGTTPWPWSCLHRAHRPSSSRIWSRSKPAFSSSRMSMPVCLADSSRRPCAGTVIVVPGPRKRRWLVARRGSSSKSWVSSQRISVRFVSATGPEHAKAARRARRTASARAGPGRRRRPRTARLRRRSPPSSTVLVTSRSRCVLRAGALEPVDAAPAARPSRPAARRRRRRNRAHRGERDGVGLNLDPASHRPAFAPVGGLGGPCPALSAGRQPA